MFTQQAKQYLPDIINSHKPSEAELAIVSSGNLETSRSALKLTLLQL